MRRSPQWAYRDMLFILIDYGERAHEVVFGPMTEGEHSSHYGVALALGRAMHLSGLPTTYAEYRDQVLAGTAQRWEEAKY